MKGMMLTAGLGTRLRPITSKWAKPAVPFLGIPLLKYPLYLMRAAGVNELVLNSHYKSEQIDALAREIASADFPVHVSHEAAAPLGAGGGIWKARQWLDDGGDFLVCNGDEVILPHDPLVLEKFKAEHLRTSAVATILVMKHPLVGTQFGGVWCAPDGSVRGFGKDPKAFGADSVGYHYIGLLLLNSRVFSYLPEGESNILYDGLAKAIAAGETVRALVSDFTWFETGNPHDLLEATGEALRLLDRGHGENARALKAITSLYWEKGTVFEKQNGALLLKAPLSTLSSSARVTGFAVLEKNAHVGDGASIENSILMPDAVVSTSAKNEIVI